MSDREERPNVEDLHQALANQRKKLPDSTSRAILAPDSCLLTSSSYFLLPRRGFRSCDWRVFIFFLLGLEILKVPLPTYSA